MVVQACGMIWSCNYRRLSIWPPTLLNLHSSESLRSQTICCRSSFLRWASGIPCIKWHASSKCVLKEDTFARFLECKTHNRVCAFSTHNKNSQFTDLETESIAASSFVYVRLSEWSMLLTIRIIKRCHTIFPAGEHLEMSCSQSALWASCSTLVAGTNPPLSIKCIHNDYPQIGPMIFQLQWLQCLPRLIHNALEWSIQSCWVRHYTTCQCVLCRTCSRSPALSESTIIVTHVDNEFQFLVKRLKSWATALDVLK